MSADSEGNGDISTQEAITLSEIQEVVDADKALALDVVKETNDAIGSLQMYQLRPDITGAPGAAEQFNRYKKEQYRNLQHVKQSPFFARFKAKMSSAYGDEEIAVLITHARDVAGAVPIAIPIIGGEREYLDSFRDRPAAQVLVQRRSIALLLLGTVGGASKSEPLLLAGREGRAACNIIARSVGVRAVG